MIRMPLAPAAIRFSMAATWPSLSPSTLPAKAFSVDAEFLGLGLGAFLHLDEERVGVGLGDQAGADVGGRRRSREGHQRRAAAAPNTVDLQTVLIWSRSFLPVEHDQMPASRHPPERPAIAPGRTSALNRTPIAQGLSIIKSLLFIIDSSCADTPFCAESIKAQREELSGGDRHCQARFARVGRSRYHRGTNQSGMRDHNERLVLSLVRQHGSLAKTEIARHDQAFGADRLGHHARAGGRGLLLRNEPMRGKIGQPSIPMALNPEGAFFLGLKIGRRSAELVLIDFLGAVRAMLQHSYRYPAPRETVEFVSDGIKRMRAGLTPAQDKRIAGLGIAMPFELWNWADTAGAPREVMDALARPRHPRRHPGAVRASRSICRTTRRRPAAPSWCSARRRHAARLHLFLHRRLRRRRHRAQRRPLRRPDRQCRRARLDAGARRRTARRAS